MVDFGIKFNNESRYKTGNSEVIDATYRDLDTGKVSFANTLNNTASKFQEEDFDVAYDLRDSYQSSNPQIDDVKARAQGTANLVAQFNVANGLPAVRNHFVSGANERHGGAFSSFAQGRGAKTPPLPNGMNTLASA